MLKTAELPPPQGGSDYRLAIHFLAHPNAQLFMMFCWIQACRRAQYAEWGVRVAILLRAWRQAFGLRPSCVRRRCGLPCWEAFRDDSLKWLDGVSDALAYRLRGFAITPIHPCPTLPGDYSPSLCSPWRAAPVVFKL
jgi:hypothetical protein